MKNTLIEYVRIKRGAKKGQPRGVVVATDKGLGWSCVNTKDHAVYDKKKGVYVNVVGDTFDKARGLEIALARCEAGSDRKMPHDVVRVVTRMVSRAAKYFKPATV